MTSFSSLSCLCSASEGVISCRPSGPRTRHANNRNLRHGVLRQVALSEIVFAHGLPFTSKSLWTLNVRSTSMTLPLVSLAFFSLVVSHS